ncbi:FeMo cofactor biosynthesis protein NifB [compost metagenome]
MEEREAVDESTVRITETKPNNEGGAEADSSSSASNSVRIAVATRGDGKVNVHFGHATEFWIYNVSGQETEFLEKRSVEAYCSGRTDCVSPDDKKKIFDDTAEMLGDCRIILCAGIGDSPRSKLLKRGIISLAGRGGIEELLLESLEFYRDLGF